MSRFGRSSKAADAAGWMSPRSFYVWSTTTRSLRPACRRCTARAGIPEPVACHLPSHQTVCRRHRLWTGPAARSHAA
jgi:hypothetical protein